jgi:predicted DNA-binding antitoxin AbrB/MazE fold protein
LKKVWREHGELLMAISVEAIYENGTLRLAVPLPLREHEKVRVTVHTQISRARRTAGLMGWTGSVELADCFATDPDLDFPPGEEL